ncbi:MAG TPA: UDP-N-acetylmuramate dehydrogenase [Chlamydiales bacterium]|nr:UDP-N-acetylmuramate dehydrogenase [Chlamydiales bacterium]
MEIYENHELKPYSTFNIGGLCRFFLVVRTEKDLLEAFAFIEKHHMPYFILGGGSNILFDSFGYRGIVIYNQIKHVKHDGDLFVVGSGTKIGYLISKMKQKNLSGLEFGLGIPATVGGMVYMNAGASGSSISDYIHEVVFVNKEGKRKVFSKKEIDWGYRVSSFQKMEGMVQEVSFVFPRKKEKDPYLFFKKRKKSQPLNKYNIGCIFKNFEKKTAGELIDQCGLKGLSVGDAQISNLHANFIVNNGNATSQDVMELIDLIKNLVHEKTGYQLREEIIRVR